MAGCKGEFVLLLGFIVVVSGQSCYKRFVKGKWISHGNCEVKEPALIPSLQAKSQKEARKVTKIDNVTCLGYPLSSAKFRDAKGGVFDINIARLGKTEIYCDAKTDGGNWTVFQRRIDGRVNFNRNWTEYNSGFGRANGEFWLGLDAIHQLTKGKDCELRIDMVDKKTGNSFYVKYSHFMVHGPRTNFTLSIGGYSGTAANSLNAGKTVSMDLHGMPFSTINADNDNWADGSCASRFKGGWWFNSCAEGCLNGAYNPQKAAYGIVWYDKNGTRRMSLSFTEMKFRKKL